MSGKILLAAAPIFASCADIRNLYDESDGMLHVEGSWQTSLGVDHMHDATVIMFNGSMRSKEFLSQANVAQVKVTPGEYDVAVFNGVMESEDNTNLDHVYFRGTREVSTFEVCAAAVPGSSRFSRAEGEYIASNSMELFTFAHHRVSFDGDSGYLLKYENGVLVRPDDAPWHAGRIESKPRALSFRYRVRLTNLINPRGVRVATGAMRGFMGSVFVPCNGSPPQSGFAATHHLPLAAGAEGRTRVDESGTERGGVETPWFVTFGPSLDLQSSRRYTFEAVFVLADGTEVRPEPIDVTDQVTRHIERMHQHHGDGEDIAIAENAFEIVIDREIVLPPLAGGGAQAVGVDDWGEDEIVIVWI